MKTYSFEKLEVWQNARSFVKEIYLLTYSFPENEKYNLSSQIRRAAVSVATNISEGSSRLSSKDQARFYEIAYGSLMEVLNLLILSQDLTFIHEGELEQMRNKVNQISRNLRGLRKSRSSKH